MSPVDEKPTYWRSITERDDQPAFRKLVEREFAEPLDPLPPDAPERRRFLQIMGASMALAGVSGCRWKEDKLMPLAQRPENWVPGETRQYATVMELSGVGTGLLVTSFEGRPIKVEGNPAHPDSRGGASSFHQASILEFYDPDRSTEVARRSGGRAASSFAEFETFLKPLLATLKGAGGAGLRILAEPSSSPTRAALAGRVLAAFPQAKWVEWEPVSRDNERAGSALAFGKPHRTQLALDKAAVILSLDADVIAPTHPAGVGNARLFAEGRVPEKGVMSRVYAVESSPTLTGITGDHRLALRSELIKAFAAALDAELGAKARPLPELGAAQAKPNAAFLAEPNVAKFLNALVADLTANVGKSIVVAGANQPPEVHALVHRLNAVLGNVGIESFHPVNLARFLRVLWDDVDGCAAVGIEMYEGFKHFHALRMYLDIAGFEPAITDEELIELRRAGAARDFPASEVLEHLVEFMLSEHLAAYFFRRLAERAEEPVLAELLRYIAADEVRHAQSASDLIAKRLARDPALADRVLAAAVSFHHYGEEAIGQVPVAMPGDSIAIRTFAERIERLCGRRLVDHLKTTL